MRALAVVTAIALLSAPLESQSPGYYRFPTVAGHTIVFTAEGDLWRVPLTGGTAQRLTTAPGEESHPALSPDGKLIAFSASYEGPTEVYTMPADGGAPTRQTYEGDGGVPTVVGWTPDGRVLFTTRYYSGLPDTQLASVDPMTHVIARVPLAQAADGSYDASNGALLFTRYPFQGSSTKRYRGGTAQNIWKFARDAVDAVPLTADYTGTSSTPMVWQGRVYFLSDRSGTMNLWSMDEAGRDLKQLTRHTGFDAQGASVGGGHIVYQLGADLRDYDIASGHDAEIPITLVSDFDQTRERWVKNPVGWITSAHLSPTGDRLVLAARGELYVAPVRQGRFVDATRDAGVRWREGRFMADGKTLLGMSDQSGEQEFWTVKANGVGAPVQQTRDATVLRWDGVPSPDGQHVAHTDKNQQLWMLDLTTHRNTRIATNAYGGFSDLSWSPDSKWLAYVAPGANSFDRIMLLEIATGVSTPVTSDRYNSDGPAWSPDGRWLYFLSDRNLESAVGAPWGSRQPEPFFDHEDKVYALALAPGARSPFQADDELAATLAGHPADDSGMAMDSSHAAVGGQPRVPVVHVVLDGIASRLTEVPLPAGNYDDLSTDGKRLYLMTYELADEAAGKGQLRTVAIDNKRTPAETFLAGVSQYELSADGRHVLVRRDHEYYVFDAGAKAPAEVAKSRVDFGTWEIHFDPRAEWRQMFADAWRLERDYFWDRGMSGVDWTAVRARYAPLVERVTDRAELSDVLSQMIGELSTLHMFVYGGDMRHGGDSVHVASLGALLERDAAHGGYRVAHVFRTDPDLPDALSPLARSGVDVQDGDVITTVNGIPTLSVTDIGALLRDEVDKQVLLHVDARSGGRDVIVSPISAAREANLRYAEWEYTRRVRVDSESQQHIGYVHLRAMGSADIAQWTRDFYPVFNRDGLIVDVRHNRGGNIDSWILERLLRRPWFYWQDRVGAPYWNMQGAFRGHVVVLTDAFTASDGEAFSEGFRRLGLGKLIGTRTWGGEIWLSSSNTLVDRGIATAAENGVYGPERQWLIEGHGVDPDIVVDNTPHATFEGHDAQLEAAIAYLKQEIHDHPVPVPPHPAYPDKSLRATQAGTPKKP